MDKKLRLHELKEKAKAAYEYAHRMYGDCFDGSFEVALSFAGYYEMIKEIKKLESDESGEVMFH
jgi:hypothetical protein